MRSWHCEECGSWRTTEDKVVMNICKSCQVEMKKIEEKEVLIDDEFTR